MKKLIIIRHGDYRHTDGTLSDLGRSQILMLTEKLKPLLNGDLVRLLSSPALRARQSAEIISHGIGDKPVEEHRSLRIPDEMGTALQKVISIADSCDAIIVVSHLEYASRFPWLFGSECLGAFLSGEEIPMGSGLVINCLEKTVSIIE